MSKQELDLRTKNYRSIPFWSWNDKLDMEQLKKQIHWMHDNGIGGFFMHARAGLQTEYLCEDWMKCIEACAEEAEKLGMDAWIYDENGWPSGFVGGKLLENEEDRDKYILAECGTYDGAATVSYLVTEDELIRVFSGNEEGEYLNLYIHTAVSTADILNPEVVKKFLALTHEKYKEHFGEKFAEKIKGFFTDEPQYHRANTPYTVMVEQYWKEQFQEDILDGLGLLFVEKKGYRRFRYRYWKALQELMLSNFAKTVYEWCDKNHVQLTGHYVEEVSMGFQVMCCAGVMPFYEYEHIPGMDWLAKDTDSELAAKQVWSVASQLGKKQVLTETFGCCGWDVTPRDLRRIAGFQYANGINLMCQHLVPYSERGTRKYDCPAHYSDVNPWVAEDYKSFNDYFTRVGYFLGEGKQHVNVAMLHPIRSSYFDYKRALLDDGFDVVELDEELKRACRTLSSRGIDYHFLDETLLGKYGFVEGASIGCGKCSYEYLVLPTMLTMDKTTEILLRRYVLQGGKLLLLGQKPTLLEAEPYEYKYLNSTVSLEDISLAQPYQVADCNTQLYSTYRTMGEDAYIYVVNASGSESYKQSYNFGSHVKSFRKVDLGNMSDTIVPLDICLNPGEDAFLYLSDKEPKQERQLRTYDLQFTQASVTVSHNYFPIDYIRYSTDGEHYSEPWPCPALFQKLLKERYKGTIYFRYEFEVDTIPEELYLRTEKSNDIAAWVNGKALAEPTLSKGEYIKNYNIKEFVTTGRNYYTVAVDWYNSDNIYFALFGENVTESLQNCIAYDTELQPIELVGSFGVYPTNGYQDNVDTRFVIGEDFYIGKMPDNITEPSVEGFPFFAGRMTLQQKVEFYATDILLHIPGDYHMAYVKVNGIEVGRLMFEQAIDISNAAQLGENDIEVCFVIGNRNHMGPHHCKGDKDGPIIGSDFDFQGGWKEDKHQSYHEDYDIKKLF